MRALFRHRRRFAAAVILALVSIMVAPAAAIAACPSSIITVAKGADRRIPFTNVPTFKNGPGGTMTVTKSYSGTASFTVAAGVSTEAGAILAKAKVEISASLTLSNTTTATNSYSRTITAGKYGNAQYVSWGMTINWTKTYLDSKCHKIAGKGSSGKIHFPSTKEGWYYWETST